MNGFDRGVSHRPLTAAQGPPFADLTVPSRCSQSVFSVPVYSEASGRSNASGSGQVDNSKTISDLQQFVTEFREHDAFIYRDRLRANCLRKEWTLEVEMGHLIGWREDLASRCRNEPGEMLPLVSL